MGACSYCGQSAGLFSTEHKECREKHDQAPGLLRGWADEALGGRTPMDTFQDRLQALQRDYYLRPEEVRSIVAAAMSKSAGRFLEDGLLTDEEEQLLRDMQGVAGITMNHIGAKELVKITREYGFSRWGYAALLRDNFFAPKESLDERRQIGRAMAEMNDPRLGPSFPFRLAADEFLGDKQNAIVYYKTKTTRQYVGGSHGVSMRLGAGVYYRIGAFNGQPLQETELQRVDMGDFAYSNRAIYFWGEKERVRLPIESIMPHSISYDSITIWRDRANARPEVFRGDPGFGWYVANVIANIHLMDREAADEDEPVSLKAVTPAADGDAIIN